jgi:hypothetical protein
MFEEFKDIFGLSAEENARAVRKAIAPSITTTT